MYIRQVSANGGGNNNRTFGFLGRILVPAAVFFCFFGGFLHVFDVF